MLRCPDSHHRSNPRLPQFNLRAVFVAVTLIGVLTAVAINTSFWGTIIGVVAATMFVMLGIGTGLFVTHVMKVPRDGSGVPWWDSGDSPE